MEQTFFKQKDEECLKKEVKNDLTKIKVKRIVEVKLEDSISYEPVRRSSRKRSASRSPMEREMKDKKTRDLVTIAIREPEDLLLMDEAPGSSTKDEA